MEEVIRIHLESLYKESDTFTLEEDLERIKEKHKELDILKEFIDDLEKSLENIAYLKIESILPSMFSSLEIMHIKETVRLIRLVLQAKNEKKFPVELSNEQKEFLENLLLKIKEQKNSMEQQLITFENKLKMDCEQKDVLADKIIDLSILLEKILDPNDLDFLNQDDFLVFYECVLDEEIPYEKRKAALVAWKNYNDKHNLSDKKIIEKVDMASVRECFSEYGLLDVMDKYLNKYESEIVYRADIANIRSILKYLKEEDPVHNKPNLLPRFEPMDLLTICIYGTLSSVQARFEKMLEKNEFFDIYFETPSIWIRNLFRKKKGKTVFSNSSRTSGNAGSTLGKVAHLISLDEMEENERFLQGLGFDVSIRSSKNVAAIKTPNYKLKENLRILEQYKIFDPQDISHFPVSTLTFSDLALKCDNLIEVGLLNSLDGNINYINNYPSRLQMNSSFLALLYKLKNEMGRDEYYQTIFSEKRLNTLNSDFYRTGFKKYAGKADLQDFVTTNFVDFSCESEMLHYDLFKELVTKNFELEIDSSIFQDDLIQKLENFHRVNGDDYHYVFGSVSISRLKVLRIYSILKGKNVSFLQEALLFAITYNSFLNKESYQLILDQLGFKKGGLTNGLS